jgi:SagB-type dehydrogenase family enzyme
MTRHRLSLILACLWLPAVLQAEPAPATVELPAPQTTGGMPLAEALAGRQSGRNFSPRPLSHELLSSLLWSATGVNRPGTGKRTAPTARNWQEVDVYVAMESGLYRYDAVRHVLEGVLARDIRAEAGIQEFVAVAPVVLIYVADHARMAGSAEDHRVFYSAVDTGFISQNVYLTCAANGLSTVVLGMVDKAALKEVMGLRPEQHVQLSQPVGYPAAAE